MPGIILACASDRLPAESPPRSTGSARFLEESPGCPHQRVYVARSGGEEFDQQLNDWAGRTYSDALREQGFEVVRDPDEAHWLAKLLVAPNPLNAHALVWVIQFEERPGLYGGVAMVPANYSRITTKATAEELENISADDVLGMSWKGEFFDHLGHAAHRVARRFGSRITRHCNNLDAALEAEQRQLELLREQLADEIRRVREERRREEDRKQLQLEVQGPPAH